MLVAADDERDLREALRQLAVFREGEMSDGHDDIDAFASERREPLSHRLRRRDDLNLLQRIRPNPLACDAQPEEPYFQRSERTHDVRRRAANRFPGSHVDDVRDDPLPLGFGHSLNEQVGTEIELMVAKRRQIESRGVQRRNHLFALEHG